MLSVRALVHWFVRSFVRIESFYQYPHASRPSVHTRFQERSTSALNTDWHSLCVCTKLSFLGMPCPPVSPPVPLSSLGFRHRPGASVTLRYSPCPHGGTTLFVALAQAKSASPPRDEMPRSECKWLSNDQSEGCDRRLMNCTRNQAPRCPAPQSQAKQRTQQAANVCLS